MASNTSPSPASPAPWRSAFLEHIGTMKSPEFVLSTLHSSPSDPKHVFPRARTVIYRGMWASIPVNSKNPAPLNPGLYESDLLTITTDSRMEKVPELFGSASLEPEKKKDSGESGQSGKGGPIEAVFWAPERMTQWRIRGHAYVVGPDIDGKAAEPVRAALQSHMRWSGDQQDKEHTTPASDSWSFSRELTAHFGNLSPAMRGTFRNPPPGTPVTEKPGEGLGLGQKVEDVEDDVARRNFRVVVLVPEEVDQVDLSDMERARKWNYEAVDGGARWEVTELWP